MRALGWFAALAAATAIPASGQAPAQLQPVAAQKTVLAAPSSATVPAAAHDLTKADVDSWLDGFMPYALKSGGIPGAVVVVVKDGQPLTMRGFGYSDVAKAQPVDPEMTLFRPGSVSKLFTWTAVMQQVQAGKLDLDKDINTYLDFKIPEKFGKPITLRDLMSHTPGFAETAKGLILYDNAPPPLGKVLASPIPERIYAPGEVPAYSNYGASLAGYIVERVSGEPFNQYVAKHIFAPAGMTHSTFDQPLPASLKPLMSKAYQYGSDDPKRYEVIPMAPAGALASSGADMGRFMIAQLANPGPLVNPQTAALLHGSGNKPYSALPGMALGFYHEDRNGLSIVGHGGDTIFFHSDLHLFLDKNVGLYISMNSIGKGAAGHSLRGQLFEDFTDRYFPQPAQNLPTASTAKAHGQAMAGRYVSSRAAGFNWLRLTAIIGQTVVAVDKDGILTVSTITDASDAPRKWREIGPWTWQEVNGSDKLQAIVDSAGKVKMFSITPYAPIIEFLPAPASLDGGWLLPTAGLAMLIMLVAAIGWPVVALVRRRYKYASDMKGRPLQLHRAARVTGWLFLVLAIGWLILFTMISKDLAVLDGGLDGWMRLLQLILVLAIVGALAALWNAWTVFREPGRHRIRTIWAVAVGLSAAFLAWFCLDMGLLTSSLNY